MSEPDSDLEDLMARLSKLLKLKRDIRFQEVISALYGHRVEKFDITLDANAETLENIEIAVKQSCRDMQDTPIIKDRPNEVGNAVEPFLITALKRIGFNASSPTTSTGKGRSTGYPDILVIRHDQLPIYIEVKTFSQKAVKSTMRSFYLSPSDDPKVSRDAHHIAVGYEIETTQGVDGSWPVSYEIVDLFDLKCGLKAEFNSNNVRLYEKNRILIQGKVPRT